MLACDPILKWPGGKRGLLRHLLPLVPKTFNRYIEPFVGGGALFFALLPKQAMLSDSNEELINCYRIIRNRPNKLLLLLSEMPNSMQDYYRVRSTAPETKVGRAARMLYLTTLSFNGIFRVNRDGVFNVPYGHKTHLKIFQPEKIMLTKRALKSCEIHHLDFEEALLRARKGDFIYLDPPYTVAHDNNGFRKYNAKIFSWEDQARLANAVHNLNQKGCYIVMSNASHKSIRSMYKDFTQTVVTRSSSIAASPVYRRYVEELIITNVV